MLLDIKCDFFYCFEVLVMVLKGENSVEDVSIFFFNKKYEIIYVGFFGFEVLFISIFGFYKRLS